MGDQVKCSKSGSIKECQDNCKHRDLHTKYSFCDIGTCGGAVCIPEIQPLTETKDEKETETPHANSQ